MNNNINIKELVMLLNEQLDKITTEEDKKNIIYLCNSLERIQNELPTLEELEKLKKLKLI